MLINSLFKFTGWLFSTRRPMYLQIHIVPDPGKMLITPFGNPALAESSANLSAVSGVTWKHE